MPEIPYNSAGCSLDQDLLYCISMICYLRVAANTFMLLNRFNSSFNQKAIIHEPV
jgi:hypothetical protein